MSLVLILLENSGSIHIVFFINSLPCVILMCDLREKRGVWFCFQKYLLQSDKWNLKIMSPNLIVTLYSGFSLECCSTVHYRADSGKRQIFLIQQRLSQPIIDQANKFNSHLRKKKIVLAQDSSVPEITLLYIYMKLYIYIYN